MVKHIIYLLLLLSLASLTLAAPTEDRVHFPVANYS